MNNIIDKILLRPAVPEKEEEEIYIARMDDKAIVLHECGSNTWLLYPDGVTLPGWIAYAGDPVASLNAWTYDWNTPDNCLLLGLSKDVLTTAFRALETGVYTVVYLNYILAARRKNAIIGARQLISGSDAVCLAQIRRQVIDGVWDELTKALAYDLDVAESRKDRMRSERIAAVDKEINDLSEQLSKCYVKRLELIRGGKNESKDGK